MNLRVPGHRLLIKPIAVIKSLQEDVPDFLRSSGFEISVGDKRTELMYEHGVERGTVVAVGNMAWRDPDLGYGIEGWKPWAEIGDEVIFVKYSGRPCVDPISGDEYLVINDVDVYAVVEKAA